MSASPAWSDDRVTTLSKLWSDGLSASQIARQLGGVTRNAVIGKVHRLGLGGRTVASTPKGLSKPSVRRQPRAAAGPAPSRPPRPHLVAIAPPPEGPGLVARMVDLSPHACRWPIGDPKSLAFSFCGQRAEGRYCAAHERLGTRPSARWRADQDPVVKRALAGLA